MLATFKTSLDAVKKQITSVGEDLIKANETISNAIVDCDADKFNSARNYVKNISSKTNDIDNAIIKILALYTPEARDLRRVIAYFKITNELSRACSNTRSFIRGFSNVCSDLDVEMIKEYALPMQKATTRATQIAVSMIDCEDTDDLQERYEEVLIEENKVDDLYGMIEQNLIQKAEMANGGFEKYHKMLRALRKSEKVAGRAIAMANLLLYAKIGGELHAS